MNDVMMKALRAKYTQNESLKKLLIDTGRSILREASPYDSYWGIGKNGAEQNHLGKMLMQIRTELIA